MTEAKRRANKKWNEANVGKMYDRANILFPKGVLDIVKAHAGAKGESLSKFVNRAIVEAMARDASQQ